MPHVLDYTLWLLATKAKSKRQLHNDPERIARVNLYAARANLGLPLFPKNEKMDSVITPFTTQSSECS